MRIAVVGGSREARLLRDRLPETPGLALAEEDDASAPDAVIDARHPFETAPLAFGDTDTATVPCLRFRRPAWTAGDGDRWIEVADGVGALDALRPEWRRVFLCLGRQERQPFLGDGNRWYLVRSSASDIAAPPKCEVTAKAGPFTVEGECALMQDRRVDVLVTRNAGGKGAYPKVAAARRLGLPTILLAMPPVAGAEAQTGEEVLAWLEALSSR